MKQSPPISHVVSLTDASTGKRVRVSPFPVPRTRGSKASRVVQLQSGIALVPAPLPILGYCYRREHLTVYVNGSMPLALRTAEEEGRTSHEVWLVDSKPLSIQEIDITDCRDEFAVLLPQAA